MSVDPGDLGDAPFLARQILIGLVPQAAMFGRQETTERYVVPQSGRVFLSGRPAREILAVEDSRGAVVDVANCELLGGSQLILKAGTWSWTPGFYVDVTYAYGIETPGMFDRAVDALAEEIVLFQSGRESRLPDRVTTVARQGVTWTLIDPQDFLDDGRTGITAVDLVIRRYNPAKAVARSRVFSPESRPGQRIN